MKQPKKKTRSIWVLFSFGFVPFIVLVVAGILYYHHYEYQAISFKFSSGTGATISRHNFNEMTTAEKQVFLHPVNESTLHPCTGNALDECIAYPSVDFWPIGSEGASNPYLNESLASSPNEIMGRIVVDSGDTLQLKTSSGNIVSVEYPLNTVINFNTHQASSYGFSVDRGDEIYVSYTGFIAKNNTINKTQIIRSSLITNGSPKTGPITKY